MRFDELPEDAHWFMNQLLETYLDVNGHPDTMTRDDAKRALVWLFENNKAQIVTHGNLGEPGCRYEIQVDETFANGEC